MASKTYIWPETSPQAIQFWEVSASGPVSEQVVTSYLDGSGLAQYVSTTYPLPVTLSGGGTITIGNVTMNDPTATTGTISAADVATTSTVNSNGQTVVTGTPTANSSVSATLTGYSGATIKLIGTGTTTGTFAFERSVDGGTVFTPLSVELIGIGTSASSYTITDNNAIFFRGNTGELTTIRVRCTAKTFTSFAVTIQPGYGVSNVIANQGPQNVSGSPWFVTGNIARGTTDSGNPNKIGGLAQNPDSPVAAVTALQRVDEMFDLNGRPVVYLGTTMSYLIDSIRANQGVSVNQQSNLAACQATNSTTAGTTFAALSMTASAPTASSTRTVITWSGQDNLVLVPWGVGSNNNTFKLRVTGWITDSVNWFPTTLFDCTCTMSSSLTGVSGQVPPNTSYFCDTITAGVGTGLIIASPADDTGIASLLVPIGNYQRVEIQFIINASATSCNASYTTY